MTALGMVSVYSCVIPAGGSSVGSSCSRRTSAGKLQAVGQKSRATTAERLFMTVSLAVGAVLLSMTTLLLDGA